MSTDTSNIFPGKCVVYRWRHGQVRAFQDEAAAMIVRVRMGNVVDLIVFPAGDRDFMFFENVAPYSQETQTHCWRHNQDDTRIADLEDQVEALKENLADATAKLEALERPKVAKPRGRPKKYVDVNMVAPATENA